MQGYIKYSLLVLLLSTAFAIEANKNTELDKTKAVSAEVDKSFPAEMPAWFKAEMQTQVGTWQTSNAEYQGENEPFSHYQIEWNWGLGQESVTGRLFAIHNDQPTPDFWTFLQYWDPLKGQARVIQLGHGGRVGDGYIKPVEEGELETIQTFSAPDKAGYSERHLNQMTESGLRTTSYHKNETGTWQQQRSYLWVKQTPKIND